LENIKSEDSFGKTLRGEVQISTAKSELREFNYYKDAE
jgi:hypothetical protein